MSAVRTFDATSSGNYVYTRWLKQLEDSGYQLTKQIGWSTDEKDIGGVDEIDGVLPIFYQRTGGGTQYKLFTYGDTLAYLYLTNGHVYPYVAGAYQTEIDATIDMIKEVVPKSKPEQGKIPIHFWNNTHSGPTQRTRQIEVPEFSAIEDNYTLEVREQLETMMAEDYRPAFGGQLVLWLGQPGTGKTWALRSLAESWKDWADFHFVVDPDALFGSDAGYLLHVLLHESDEDKWKVLILEDTGELLSADAKARTGQSLSRLLNVVDGIIGQGLKILCLVTTNEEIRNLHAAVARPGRCAAKIEFKPLTSEESYEWLEARDVPNLNGSTEAMTLANLYALAEGYTELKMPVKMGFV